MYQEERIDEILKILKQNGYVTVKYLTDTLHYSNATINRDLNIMTDKKLVARSYGGVKLIDDIYVPLKFRYHKMELQKKLLGSKAAELVNDGDKIFIDGSTTGEGIGTFLTDKKDLTVVTNNMALTSFLSEHKINVICTGGIVEEIPSMLSGNDAIRTVKHHRFDKMFFSTGGFTEDCITTNGGYELLFETAMQNSDKTYYLADKSKYNAKCKYIFKNFSSVTAVISDYKFPDETEKKYGNTKFYDV